MNDELTGEALNDKLAALQARREERLRDDLRTVLKLPAGRRALWGLMERAGTFRLSYVSERPHDTAFNDGRRDMGNYLLNQVMDVDVKIFAQMQREHRAEKAKERKLSEIAR